MIPNRLPSTANVPTAATADPAADAIDAPTSCEQPVDVVESEQGERRDDEDVGDRDDEARLDEDLEPVAAADRDDAGQPADEDVRRELELAAGLVHRPAEQRDHDRDDRRDAGVEQDREQDADGGGRNDERRPGRSAVALSSSACRRPAAPISSSALFRCQSSRRNRQIQAEPQADHEDRQEQPAAEAGDVGPGVAEPVLVDDLELLLGDLVAAPDDRLVQRDVDGLRLDLRGGLRPGRRSVRSALKNEFGDDQRDR